MLIDAAQRSMRLRLLRGCGRGAVRAAGCGRSAIEPKPEGKEDGEQGVEINQVQ